MRDEFISAIKANRDAFGLDLSADAIDRLADHYDIVLEHNDLLHLVAPCSPTDFAIRHILESLTLLEHLPFGAKFADVGTGAGLPSIPCLIVREDLKAVLIESKEKKSAFLNEAVEKLDLRSRAQVVNKQFAETQPDDCEFVTCRALDKFVDLLPRLLKWSGHATLLFFGGNSLGEALRKNGIEPLEVLMPFSEQRYLFVSERGRKK